MLLACALTGCVPPHALGRQEGFEPAVEGRPAPLEGLPPGRHPLRVTVNDQSAKTTAEQRASFTIK